MLSCSPHYRILCEANKSANRFFLYGILRRSQQIIYDVDMRIKEATGFPHQAVGDVPTFFDSSLYADDRDTRERPATRRLIESVG